MQIILDKKPKGPVIIQGFPGIGLIGTISTEYLIEHLNMKQIGTIKAEEIPPLIAIHDEKVVQPLGIFYDEKSNIVVVHVVANLQGLEWKLGAELNKLAKDLAAKEVVSLEGVSSNIQKDEIKVYFVSTNNKTTRDKLMKVAEPLKEGVIVGVSAAMLVNKEIANMTCFFAETHMNLPDSKAAAKLIESLDKYIGLKVDPAPLLKQAEIFEEKLKKIISQGQKAQEVQESKQMNYFG